MTTPNDPQPTEQQSLDAVLHQFGIDPQQLFGYLDTLFVTRHLPLVNNLIDKRMTMMTDQLSAQIQSSIANLGTQLANNPRIATSPAPGAPVSPAANAPGQAANGASAELVRMLQGTPPAAPSSPVVQLDAQPVPQAGGQIGQLMGLAQLAQAVMPLFRGAPATADPLAALTAQMQSFLNVMSTVSQFQQTIRESVITDMRALGGIGEPVHFRPQTPQTPQPAPASQPSQPQSGGIVHAVHAT